MIWDTFSGVYDIAEKAYNGKVYDRTGEIVAEYIDPCDDVLECACGTGAISIHIAKKCKSLTATDMSVGMLRQCEKKLRQCYNTRIRKADITRLKCGDSRYDKVVAGNVIHLLDDPAAAIAELKRVCKPGGLIILPTYINKKGSDTNLGAQAVSLLGVEFKKEFDAVSYPEFLESLGLEIEDYRIARGRMPCAVAVIKNTK